MLLLVVLSLLVLFSLVGLTFVLVASRYYDTVKRSLRNEQVGSSPRDLCDDVLAQLVRGTNNPMSAIRSHDLLGDMYGNDGIVCNSSTAITVQAGVGGQLIDVILPRFGHVAGVRGGPQRGGPRAPTHSDRTTRSRCRRLSSRLLQWLRADVPGRSGGGPQHADRRLELQLRCRYTRASTTPA